MTTPGPKSGSHVGKITRCCSVEAASSTIWRIRTRCTSPSCAAPKPALSCVAPMPRRPLHYLGYEPSSRRRTWAPAAVLNAVDNALRSYGAQIERIPVLPEGVVATILEHQ